jgi:hypothetical protein
VREGVASHELLLVGPSWVSMQIRVALGAGASVGVLAMDKNALMGPPPATVMGAGGPVDGRTLRVQRRRSRAARQGSGWICPRVAGRGAGD